MSLILSKDYANAYLDYLMGNSANLPTAKEVWLALGNITDGVFTECSGNGYARELINIVGQDYPGLIGDAANRAIDNEKQVKFDKATGDYSANAIALCPSKTASPFAWGNVTTAGGIINVVSGAMPMVEVAGFGLSMDG